MNKKTDEKNGEVQDWHRADILAAIRKAGWSLQQLSLAHGFNKQTLNRALDIPYPKAERIIATQIGKEPAEIWPSRYNEHGVNIRVRSRKPMRGILIPVPAASNTQAKTAA